MLTLQKVQADIKSETDSSARYRNATGAEEQKMYKRHQRVVDKLRELESILLLNPTEEYMREQEAKHQSRLDHIEARYEEWKQNNPKDRDNSNARGIFEKTMDIATTRRHLRYARKILAD